MTTLDVTVSMPKPGRTKYSYSLSTREGAAGPLQQEYTIDVNQELVNDACAEIDKALQNTTGDPERLGATLRRQGRLLYQQLLQPAESSVLELVRNLRESTEPLLVNSNESTVPWELLHDGEDFLGLKTDIGRRSKVGAWVHGGRHIGLVRRALVVGDTLGDLPKAHEEAEKIGRWLTEQGIECTVLLGSEAELGRIILELTDESAPYDLFHFSGHVSNSPDAMGLLVHRRHLVDEPALRTLAGRGAPPVVFINGCASAGLTMNVCRLFMVMGAKTVVGTRTVVDDGSALRFAEAFYSQLREQVAAGAAVRQARLALNEQADGSWASFVLHGDPNARITHEQRPSSSQSSGSTQRDTVPFAPDTQALMRHVSRIAEPAGLVTSLDLLAGLLETKEIRERSLPRIGQERFNTLRLALRPTSGPSGPGGDPAAAEADGTTGAASTNNGTDGIDGIDGTGRIGEIDGIDGTGEIDGIDGTGGIGGIGGIGGKINGVSGHQPQVELSDTVARVFALADEAVAAAGRGALTIDDIAAALLRVGGSTCEEMLDMHGLTMEQLLAPPGEEKAVAKAAVLRQRVPLDGLDARAYGVVLCARILSAMRGETMITSRTLLKAFAVNGSEALSDAFEAQGLDVDRTLRRLGGIGAPRLGELSSRVAQALRAANDDAGSAGRAGEAELLLALLLTDPQSSAIETLRRLNVDPELLIRTLSADPIELPQPRPEPDPEPEPVREELPEPPEDLAEELE